VVALVQATDSNPAYFRGRALIAAAEALAGNREAAARYMAEYAVLEPGMTVSRFVEHRSSVPPEAVSEVYRKESGRVLEGLRLAGMPDASNAEQQMNSF
jgi:hypothetical protein